MKKILVTGLLALAALSMVFANGSKEVSQDGSSSSEAIELRISWWGSTARHDGTLAALDLYMKENPNVKVVAEYQGFDGYHDKLITQIHANAQPDVFQLDNNVYFADLAASNMLTDLTPYIGNQIDLADYPKESLEWGAYNDIQYGIPTGLNGPVLIYNKAIFDQANVAYPTSDWTWEDFEAASFKIHKAIPKVYGIMESPDFLIEALMRQQGQWFASKDGKLLDFSKALGNVFAKYNEWRGNGVLPPLELTSSRNSQMDNLFLAGQTAMEVTHIAMLPNDLGAIFNHDPCGITMLPGTKQNGGVYMLASMPWTIGKSSKHPEEAAKLINFLINDPDACKLLGTIRGVPAPEHVRDMLAKDSDDTQKIMFQGISDLIARTTRIDYDWKLKGSSVLQNSLQENKDATGYGQISPEQAGLNVYNTLKTAIEKANK